MEMSVIFCSCPVEQRGDVQDLWNIWRAGSPANGLLHNSPERAFCLLVVSGNECRDQRHSGIGRPGQEEGGAHHSSHLELTNSLIFPAGCVLKKMISTSVYLCKSQVFVSVTDSGGRYRRKSAIRSVHLKTQATDNAAYCSYSKYVQYIL